MHLVDAWTSLAPLDLLVLLATLGVVGVAAFVPGRPVASTAAWALAALMPATVELGPPPVRWGWAALAAAVALVVGRGRDQEWRRDVPRPGGFESGTVGLLLGLGLLLVPLIAIARQDLSAEQTRWCTAGVLLVGLGLLHLMLRRDALRAALGFTVAGLGLQWLDHAVRDAALEAPAMPRFAVLAATAAVVALTARIAAVRRRDAGTTWLSHAHDLHD